MLKVDRRRIHYLSSLEAQDGPVVYWMSREQRIRDNWGLLHARELAGETKTVIVVFCLVPTFLGATLRQYDFMLRGLEEVERDLRAIGIPFILLTGNPGQQVSGFAKEVGAGAVVTDFDPLRIKKQWQEEVVRNIDVPLIEVDSHNVVPARFVTDKQEYAARTIRPKIQRLLPEFLEEYPPLLPPLVHGKDFLPVDWRNVRNSIRVDESVPAVKLAPGEAAADAALQKFTGERLRGYDEKRNDPNAEATSRLSAYYHFGHLAPQRAALAVSASGVGPDQEAYLEELIIRRELSDNFCLHNPDYDSLDGAPEWALRTLDEHSSDIRAYLYSLDEFDRAETHSALWNAAQNQMKESGFMHGYMRMYWAKKILEWSYSPEEALRIAIALNDRYQLDGRDPNGYVGVLWSIAGVHDRGWTKRPVFGSIRYMNERGCRRKFKVDAYIGRWSS